MSYIYAQTFNIPNLRQLWITNQLQIIIKITFNLNQHFIDSFNHLKNVLNSDNDYIDSNFTSLIDKVLSEFDKFDTTTFATFKNGVSLTNKYDNVETIFLNYTNAVHNSGVSGASDTDFHIITRFLINLLNIYHKTNDNNVTVNKSVLMSIEELKIHSTLYKLILNALNNILDDIKDARQFLIKITPSTSTNYLYKTLKGLEYQITNYNKADLIKCINQIDNVLIYNLRNNYTNTIQNYINLYNFVNDTRANFNGLHTYYLGIFFDKFNNCVPTNGGNFSIIPGNTLPTLTP